MINLTKIFYCESARYIVSFTSNSKSTNKKKWKQHMKKKKKKHLNFFKLRLQHKVFNKVDAIFL